MKSQNIITRRFDKIKKQFDEDKICYESPYFQLEPLSGIIYLDSKVEIQITFKPEKAIDYRSEAYYK